MLPSNFHFSCFGWETPVLGKLGPKNQNCLFKMKVGTLTNSSMLILMVMFYMFNMLWMVNTFWGKSSPKNQNSLFKLKLTSKVISICWIRWWCSLNMFWFKKSKFFKSKLGAYTLTIYFKYSECDGDVNFLLFWTRNTLVRNEICDLIKLRVIQIYWILWWNVV